MNTKICLKSLKTMNKELTIVFSSYQSQHLLVKILKQFYRKYKIIIIENSLELNIKESLEKKFKGIEVVIPKKNLGLAKSYNLGIKKTKTKFIFLNNPDLEIDDKSIEKLLYLAKKIKKFGIISPTYKNENIYKNYEIFYPKKESKSKIFRDFNVCEVDQIDNNFLVKRETVKKNLFDEKYFLYFETIDFATNLRNKGKKLYISKKIKFHHFGNSLGPKYLNLIKKTRSFHFNWSKFYYYKKNFNYFYALKKIFPNFIKALKKSLISLLIFDLRNLQFSILEILGIISSILCIKSFYRPKN